MYDCTERQSVAPRRRHVGDLDRLVSLGDLFAPVEQVLRGCEVSTAATTWRATTLSLQQTQHRTQSQLVVPAACPASAANHDVSTWRDTKPPSHRILQQCNPKVRFRCCAKLILPFTDTSYKTVDIVLNLYHSFGRSAVFHSVVNFDDVFWLSSPPPPSGNWNQPAARISWCYRKSKRHSI